MRRREHAACGGKALLQSPAVEMLIAHGGQFAPPALDSGELRSAWNQSAGEKPVDEVESEHARSPVRAPGNPQVDELFQVRNAPVRDQMAK
jgi:hypothetical protein